jgi:hypothetical protein
MTRSVEILKSQLVPLQPLQLLFTLIATRMGAAIQTAITTIITTQIVLPRIIQMDKGDSFKTTLLMRHMRQTCRTLQLVDTILTLALAFPP